MTVAVIESAPRELFSPVDDVVAAFRDGSFVLVVDDASEAGPIMACRADVADAAAVNVLAIEARGLVCLGLTSDATSRLGLRAHPEATGAVAYTESIEAATGVTTGISAHDRARTIEMAIDGDSGPDDVVSPGHLFPVETHPAGVLAIRGPAEAVVDLARMAEVPSEAGVYCHVLSPDGEEASADHIRALSERLGVRVLALTDLVACRTRRECLVRMIEGGSVPTAYGPFDVSIWEDRLDGTQHVLLRKGDTVRPPGEPAPLVRVHSQCLTGDVFGSLRCDCGAQLDLAFENLEAAGHGAVLYLRQEGRGIGLVAKLMAYGLQDRGRDTVEANTELGYDADLREYGIGAQILQQAGFQRVRLMTNNPRKISGLEAVGLVVEERVPLETAPVPANLRYLRAKKDKLGHLLSTL